MRLIGYCLLSILLHLLLLQGISAPSQKAKILLSPGTEKLHLSIKTKQLPKPRHIEPVDKKTPSEHSPVVSPTPLPQKQVAKEERKREEQSETKNEIQEQQGEQAKEENQAIAQQLLPRQVSHAEYLRNPPPQYPDSARRRGQEGTVLLKVEVDAHGYALNVSIEKSSGYSILDRAALTAVQKWRFTPATISGRAVSSQVLVPIDFQLRAGA